MAHSPSALKRWRQNEKRRMRNKPARTAARSAVKRARTLAAAGSADAVAAVNEAAAILDRAAKHKVVHRNAAARNKSRMARLLNSASAGTTEEAPKKSRKTAAKATGAKKTATKKTAAKSTTRAKS